MVSPLERRFTQRRERIGHLRRSAGQVVATRVRLQLVSLRSAIMRPPMHRTCELVKKSYFLNEWHSSRRIDSQRDVTTGFTVAARERRFNPQKLSACTSNSTSLCISCPLSGPPAPARRGARGGAARFKIAENRSQSEDYRHATTPDPTQPNQPDFMPHKSCYVLSSRKLRRAEMRT